MDKAWHLYEENQGKNIPLSIDGYNSIMSMISALKQGDDKSKFLVMDIYRTMAAYGITPNIHTFNAALSVATVMKTNRVALDFTRNILADIAKFELKPSLTTYYYLLQILNRFGNYMFFCLAKISCTCRMFTSLFAETGDAAYSSFVKILESLKEETLTIQNEKDLEFFITAMKMASQQFCNRQAGEMVNELLLTGENYKFIGNNYKVSF